ncbi:MAG: acetyl-CoA carboxylase carboxyltransferase subunit alpha [bacterium]
MSLDCEAPVVKLEQEIEELKKKAAGSGADLGKEIASLEKKLLSLKQEVYSKLTPWEQVQLARHPQRPLMSDYIRLAFSEFIELHGDRLFGDDPSLIGGFAMIDKHRVMLLGFNKGGSVEEKVKANFGMAHPEGYRKALRLVKLAEKYGIPVVSLIDTPAAYPGAAAEARGQAEAIGHCIMEMTSVEVPLIAIITGEGGSGGALGIAVADTVMMLSNAIYSVIPPEGCAAILWKDSNKAPVAAEALKITAKSLLELRVIDQIIPEPLGGAHRDHAATAAALKAALVTSLASLKRISRGKLAGRRLDKLAAMGRFK